jgi:hypothetical protein
MQRGTVLGQRQWIGHRVTWWNRDSSLYNARGGAEHTLSLIAVEKLKLKNIERPQW